MQCHRSQPTWSAVLNVAESKRKNVINAKMCVHSTPASMTEEGDYICLGWRVGFLAVSQKIDS